MAIKFEDAVTWLAKAQKNSRGSYSEMLVGEFLTTALLAEIYGIQKSHIAKCIMKEWAEIDKRENSGKSKQEITIEQARALASLKGW